MVSGSCHLDLVCGSSMQVCGGSSFLFRLAWPFLSPTWRTSIALAIHRISMVFPVVMNIAKEDGGGFVLVSGTKALVDDMVSDAANDSIGVE